MRSMWVAIAVAFSLACIWTPAAIASPSGYAVDVGVAPIRALLQRGYLTIGTATPGRQWVVLTVTAVDPVLNANSDYVVPIGGPRTVLVDHRRTLRILNDAAMRSELGSAPGRMSITVKMTRGRHVLAMCTRGFLRQRIPGVFVPPPARSSPV